jgi:uncharacterized protein
MRTFFVRLYLATFVLHVAFGFALDRAASRLGLALPWWVSVPIAAALALAFHHRLQLGLWDAPIGRVRRVFLEEPYYVHWCALLLAPPLLLVSAPALALAGSSRGAWAALADPAHWADAWLASYLMGLLLAFYGVVIRRRWVRVRRVRIEVEGLHPGLNGFVIAQLSDLHVGSMCPRARVDDWVRRTNELAPDLVALTGDFVTSGVRFHHEIAEALAPLEAPEGVFAVMGNHDYFGEGEPLMSLLKERGIRLLRNEHCLIERDGGRLCLAGVDDVYTRRIDIDRALDGRDPALPLVVLAHDPVSFVELSRRGATLVLSGHTHWGQVAMPWLAHRLSYAALHIEHHAGHYRHLAAQLYVSAGLGTTGPPVRLGAAPEIALIELSRA